jgi:dolichyl-diphosphooligosaccharide--protein glycosyltransferase
MAASPNTAPLLSQAFPKSTGSPHPSLPVLILSCVLVLGIGIGLRLLELPVWQADYLRLGGERIMAANDSYFWMAGAQGTSWITDTGLMRLLALIHRTIDLPLGTIAFFLPVLLAPLPALLLCFLAWKEDIPEAGPAAGIMATNCTGYFIRTRLGFCDTDPFALLIPTFMAVAFILWVTPAIRSSWFGKTAISPSLRRPTPLMASLTGTGLGIVCARGIWLYHSSQDLVLVMLLAAVFLVLLLGKKGTRTTMLAGFFCFYATGFGGWPGVVLALIVMTLPLLVQTRVTPRRALWVLLPLTGLALAFLEAPAAHLSTVLTKLAIFMKEGAVDPQTTSGTVLLPAIEQSVRESVNIDLRQVATWISGHVVLFWLGLPACFYLFWKRPAFVILIPFLALGIASFRLGNRFTMYGGIVLGTGMGFSLSLLLISRNISLFRRLTAQLLLCLALVWPAWKTAMNGTPTPVLSKALAMTFKDLGATTPRDARLWQWWDHGYAAQYYAGRMSFGDGSAQDGPWLYPLARVHCTDSPMQAAQLISAITAAQRDRYRKTGTAPHAQSLEWTAPYYHVRPTIALETMTAREARSFIQGLKQKMTWPGDFPAQYLVLSWENLRMAYWISYYGNWDMERGTTTPDKIQRITEEVGFDMDQGLLMANGMTAPIDSLDIVSEKETRHQEWPGRMGLHAVGNRMNREVFLMDDQMYRSMMVQMLIGPANRFEPWFTLSVDHFPWARAYQVNPAPCD